MQVCIQAYLGEDLDIIDTWDVEELAEVLNNMRIMRNIVATTLEPNMGEVEITPRLICFTKVVQVRKAYMNTHIIQLIFKLALFTENVQEEINYLQIFKVQTKELSNNCKLIAVVVYVIINLFLRLKHKVLVCRNKRNLVLKKLGAN